jgi:hypothetical protein
MRSKYILIAGVLLALGFGVGRLSAASGSLDSPAPPGSTYSYSLDDIYERLDTGAAGTQSTFAEPSSGPEALVGHTLDEIMAKAPALDDANGAIQTHVPAGRTFWGLTYGQWGLITGTMPNNGAVTLVPATTQQTIVAGYHNGSGYVEGDADLVAGNIKGGVSVFGIDGTLYAPVPKTGQTISGTVGDDGDLEKGVAWPNPRFITSTAGIVTDTLTGLIWLQDADCMGAGTWDNALTQVDNLNSGTDFSCDNYAPGTFSDWRLPNVRELHSLVHYGFYNRAVPNTAGTGKWSEGDPFTGVQPSYYWSSTTFADAASIAWTVNMMDGYVHYSSKTNGIYVWPVRGGQ